MGDLNWVIKRRYFPDFTFSTMHRPDGSQVCVMVERAWEDNQPNISCIPEGHYIMRPTVSPRFGDCYYLEGGTVTLSGPSKRTHILLHPANLPLELEGCLAAGVDFCCLAGQWAVSSSRAAVKMLADEFDGKEIPLRIEVHKP